MMFLRTLLIVLAFAGAARAQQMITVFCASGITGGGGGTRAEPGGRIVRLQRDRSMGNPVETMLGQDPAAVARWHAALDLAGFDAMRLNNPGNITCSLRRGQNALSWPFEPPSSIPPGVQAVFREL